MLGRLLIKRLGSLSSTAALDFGSAFGYALPFVISAILNAVKDF